MSIPLPPRSKDTATDRTAGGEPRPENGERTQRLTRLADDAGRGWATSWCDDLHKQGRVAAGGWPGTITEARARLLARLNGEKGLGLPLAAAEVDALTKAAYVAAKNEWRARAVRDEGP
jgi:hypothetical protein